MTPDTYEKIKDEIKYNAYIGVYILDNCGTLTLAKKAKRTNRKYPLAENLLMMYRSANREVIKTLKNRRDTQSER